MLSMLQCLVNLIVCNVSLSALACPDGTYNDENGLNCSGMKQPTAMQAMPTNSVEGGIECFVFSLLSSFFLFIIGICNFEVREFSEVVLFHFFWVFSTA